MWFVRVPWGQRFLYPTSSPPAASARCLLCLILLPPFLMTLNLHWAHAVQTRSQLPVVPGHGVLRQQPHGPGRNVRPAQILCRLLGQHKLPVSPVSCMQHLASRETGFHLGQEMGRVA